MRPASRLLLVCAAPLVALCWAPRPATAGVSLWTSRDVVSSLYVELTRPDLEVDEQGLGTAGGSVEAVILVVPGLGLVLRMPAAFADVTYPWPYHYHESVSPDSSVVIDSSVTVSDTQADLGNLYLGTVFQPSRAPALTLCFGTHAPTAGSERAADLAGVATDLTQWEDYREAGSIDLAARIRPRRRGRLADVWEARWVIYLNHWDDNVPMDFLARAILGYRWHHATIWGGLDGRLTSAAGTGDPYFFQAVMAATRELGTFRPGLHLRLPLSSSLRETSTWAIGLSCEVSPRGAARNP